MPPLRSLAAIAHDAPVGNPSRIFLSISGAYLLLTGLIGFAVSGSFPTRRDAVGTSHGHIFGVLETNGWHNAAALALAVPSLLVALRWPR